MPKENLMNVEGFERALDESGLDAVIAVSLPNVFYTSGALSGLLWSELDIPDRLIRDHLAFTILPKAGDAVLIVSSMHESLAGDESWIDDVRSYVEFAQSPIRLLADVLKEKRLAARPIGIEKQYLSASYWEELIQLLPHAAFEPCDSLFDEVRSIKTQAEIVRFQEAALATERAIVEGFREVHVGQTEIGLVDEIMNRLSALGATRVAYVVCGAGDQSVHPHPPPARRRQLEPGDLVRIDLSGVFAGYGSDVARMAAVGRATEAQSDMYAKYREVQRGAIEYMRPGVRACDVFQYCVQAFARLGMEYGSPHVGHGMGLGAHEVPMLQPYETRELRPNMLICIEPVCLDRHLGVYQLEDLILIKEERAEVLTTYADTQELFVIK